MIPNLVIMTLNKEISKEEVNNLEQRSFTGKIVVLSNEHHKAFAEINDNSVTGFDTETRPNFRKGQKNKVALIQIAIPEKVFLLRIYNGDIDQEIIKYLESDIIKVGVGLNDDISSLNELCNFSPNSMVDLNKVANNLGIKSRGLRKLSALCLGFRVSKSQQTSNWENHKLTIAQIKYAATDAWVCLEIYNKMKKQRYLYS